MLRRVDECCGTATHFGLNTVLAKLASQPLCGLLVHHHRERRLVFEALFEQSVHVAVGSEGRHAETIAMAGDHVQRIDAHAAGGTEHGDADHGKSLKAWAPSQNSGAAAVRLSTRSRRPPCPGNRLPLSLSPAWRLNRLSERS